MILLVGINHRIQYQNNRTNPMLYAEFDEYIRTIQGKYKIDVIAEEFNEDCLRMNRVEVSTLQEIAIAAAKKHCFVEATYEEREKNGIPKTIKADDVERYWKLREEIWLSKMDEYLEDCICLFCGADHIETFSVLLKSRGIEFTVIDEYWHREYFSEIEKNFTLQQVPDIAGKSTATSGVRGTLYDTP